MIEKIITTFQKKNIPFEIEINDIISTNFHISFFTNLNDKKINNKNSVFGLLSQLFVSFDNGKTEISYSNEKVFYRREGKIYHKKHFDTISTNKKRLTKFLKDLKKESITNWLKCKKTYENFNLR